MTAALDHLETCTGIMLSCHCKPQDGAGMRVVTDNVNKCNKGVHGPTKHMRLGQSFVGLWTTWLQLCYSHLVV